MGTTKGESAARGDVPTVARTSSAPTRALRRFALLLVIGLATAAGAQSAPADELKPFQASYDWIYHGMTVAVSTLKLQREDATWVYRSNSEPRGIGRLFSERPTQESVLKVTDSVTRPLSYKADDGTPSTKRDASLQYDWDRNRVTGVYEDTKVDMPLEPGIQDDLSVQIALMVELLNGRTPDKFQMIDGNSLREYRFTREGEETLATPLGDVPTIVFGSQKMGSPRITRFWCAPSQGYIPMRVEQKRGDEVQWMMRIEKLTR
jgi:Protein of unknown function (DUF3108)